MIEIDAAAPLDELKLLLREYAGALPFDMPDYEQWLGALPGEYTLLLARVDGASAGCVALRPFDAETGEIKRMYVREQFRRGGVGRALVADAIARFRTAGFTRVLLDTHSSLIPAQNLYRSFGFVEIPPYWDHPIPDVVFFELALPPEAPPREGA